MSEASLARGSPADHHRRGISFGDAVSEAVGLLEEYAAQTEGTSEARLLKLWSVVDALRAEPTEEHPVISSPADVDRLLRNRIAYQEREHFIALFLNTKNRVIDAHVVAIGTNGACPVHPREVFRPAIAAGAASVVVAHNHPSGDCSPSREDREVTERLSGAAALIGIELIDHVILGRGHTSLKERGWL